MTAPRLIKRLELGQIFTSSILVYRRNAAPILSLLVPFYLPVGTFFAIEGLKSSSLFNNLMSPSQIFASGPPDLATILSLFTPLIIALGVVLLYNMLVLPLGFIATFRFIYRAIAEKPITVREALRFAASRYWDFQVSAVYLGLILIGVTLTALLPVVLGLFLGTFFPSAGITIMVMSAWLFPVSAIAVVIILVRFIFFVLVIAEDEEIHSLPLGRRGTAILSRAANLIHGHALRVFIYLFLIAIVVWVLGSVFMSPISLGILVYQGIQAFGGGVEHQAPATLGPVAQAVHSFIGQLITLLLQPIAMVAQVLIYTDVRCRREGMDIEARLDAEVAERQERMMRYRRSPAS